MRPPSRSPSRRSPAATAPTAALALTAAALLVVTLLPAPAGAQEELFGFPHVNPKTVTLAEGQNETVRIAFEGGAFTAGWTFLLNAVHEPADENDTAPLDVELRQRGETVESWTLEAVDGPQHLHGRFTETAEAELVFSNPGPGNGSYTFFYDMSCECLGKPIPVEVPNGVVVFRVDIGAGETWKAVFPKPPVHDLEITMAKRTDERSRWPQDFQVMRVLAAPNEAPPVEGAQPRYVFEWTDPGGWTYFYLRSTAMDLEGVDRSGPGFVGQVMVAPMFTEVAADDGDGAGPSTPLGLDAVVAGVVVAAYWVHLKRKERR